MFSQHHDEAFRENTMAAKEKPTILLPKGWTGYVRSAALHVIGLTPVRNSIHPQLGGQQSE